MQPFRLSPRPARRIPSRLAPAAVFLAVVALGPLSVAISVTPAAAKKVTRANYQCDGGRRVQATYGHRSIILYLGSERFDLRQTRSGSGVRYAGRSVVWHEKGDRASFVITGGINVTCRRLSARHKQRVRTVLYNCRSGQSARMVYSGTNRLKIWLGSEQFNLRAVRSGSGARYVGRGIHWQEKGDRGLLSIRGGISTNCRRK